MSTETLIKQPSESRLYSMNFSANLIDSTIAAINSVTVTPNDGFLDVSDPPSFTGTTVKQRIAAGKNNTIYKVTIIVLDTLGNILEGEGNLWVKDS